MAALVALILYFHWVTIHHTAYAVEKQYQNLYGNVIGSYYHPKPNYSPNPFLAQCYDGPVMQFTVEQEAVHYVEMCPKF